MKWKAGTYNRIIDDGDNVIATAVSKKHVPMLAAAPEMYEALKNLENDNNQIPDLAWQMVQDAIVKAEGRGEGNG